MIIGLVIIGLGIFIGGAFTAFALVASLVGLIASEMANRVANAALNAEHPRVPVALLEDGAAQLPTV